MQIKEKNKKGKGLYIIPSLSALILSLFVIFATAEDTKSVFVGGMPFGLRMDTGGAFVVETGEVETENGKTSPAKLSGIEKGDIILSIDNKEMKSAGDVARFISNSKGRELEFKILRGGEEKRVKLTPVAEKNGQYKSGIFIKDSSAGIGTITFIKDDGTFGGLGHGVTERATQMLLPLKEGTVHKVSINKVIKGSPMHPGELKGTLRGDEVGTLLKNTDMGVFGKLEKLPENLQKVSVAKSDEIKTGKCKILTCLDGETPAELEGEISEIVSTESKTKNFIVTLTDKSGLEKTGGIVQGMSGSPIIQNGKLVGAVTHVLMRDQKSGYGIFIENMLKEGSFEPSSTFSKNG